MEKVVTESVKPSDRSHSSDGRSKSKRLLLAQQDQQIYVCDQIEELCMVFSSQIESCRQIDVPVAVILIEVANFEELKTIDQESAAVLVNETAHHLISVIRAQDILAQYSGKYIAVLLVDANQDIGAKVCQRIKESIHKFSYFHAGAAVLKLDFGVSDDSDNKYEELEHLILSAAKALKIAHDRGEGAIVRTSELDPSKDSSEREHFFPGDRLTSKSD